MGKNLGIDFAISKQTQGVRLFEVTNGWFGMEA